jgi:hypothetical protein
VCPRVLDKKNFTVATMQDLLGTCFENVEGEYAGVGHPDWWSKGSKASFLNAGAPAQRPEVVGAAAIAMRPDPGAA